MSSNVGDEKFDICEGCPMIDGEDSLPLEILSSISSEGITFLCIVKKGKQFWVDAGVRSCVSRIQDLFVEPSDLMQTQDWLSTSFVYLSERRGHSWQFSPRRYETAISSILHRQGVVGVKIEISKAGESYFGFSFCCLASPTIFLGSHHK